MDTTTQAKRKDRGSDGEDGAARCIRLKTSHSESTLLSTEFSEASSQDGAIGMAPTTTSTNLPQDGSKNGPITMAPNPMSTELLEANLQNGNAEMAQTLTPTKLSQGSSQDSVINMTPYSTSTVFPYASSKKDGDVVSAEMAESPQDRPLASGTPPVFALTRSALAEATDYFKSHESGNYHADCLTLGLLIDRIESSKKGGEGKVKFSGRDYMDGSVIITTVGGGRKPDQNGNLTWGSSQGEESRSYQYLSKAKEEGQAVIVIIGSRNEACPVKPRYPYNVCGHFMITDIWSEARLNNDRVPISYWMIRLEKVPTGQISWWVEGTADDSHIHAVGQSKCDSLCCSYCKVISKHIFTNGWTCLNHKCTVHFHFLQRLHDGTTRFALFEDVAIKYNRNFLCERSDPTQLIHKPLMPLAPPVPTDASDVTRGQGIICPKCHCCTRRIHWDRWECEEPSCDFVLKKSPKVYGMEEINRENEAFKKAEAAKTGKRRQDKSTWDNNVILQLMRTQMSGYSIDVYVLPDEQGKITGTVMVYRATDKICALPNGPNDMLLTMQEQDLKLKRGAARHPGKVCEVLCRHFAHNWGAPYRYGVAIPTSPFSETPESILRCVSQLSWAQEQAMNWTAAQFKKSGQEYRTDSMTLKPQAFNELLSLGYLPDCSINWHDDGESQLSATVASLSLGSPSVMKFRPKKSTTIGSELKNKVKTRAPVISFPLFHGDICIMHGTGIHKFYEVFPYGKVRFALTSRLIRPEALEDAEERQKAEVNGRLPPGMENLAYKGIESANTDKNSLDSPMGASTETGVDTPENAPEGVQSTPPPAMAVPAPASAPVPAPVPAAPAAAPSTRDIAFQAMNNTCEHP